MSKKILPIQDMIYEIRGHQVMLDADLAKIYHVETSRLNEVVKRNRARFPSEFMFQLTEKEYEFLRSQFAISNLKSQIATSSLRSRSVKSSMRSQIVTSKDGRGGRRYLPFVFTEHGVIMLSSVLNSKIATKINIAVVKAFIDMRRYLTKPVHEKLVDLEKILMLHIDDSKHNFSKHAKIINEIVNNLNNLIAKPPKTRRIGFTAED